VAPYTSARPQRPPHHAAANVTYLRQMLAQPNSWKKLAATPDAAAPKKPAKPAKQAKPGKPTPQDRSVHAAADPQ
jgi:hypothetical protein